MKREALKLMKRTEAALICVDARLTPGSAGGVQQAIEGLHHGLCGLPRDSEDYIFSVYDGGSDWLSRETEGCRTIALEAHPTSSAKGRLKSRVPFLTKAVRAIPQFPGLKPGLDRSDGTLEALGVDLIHFPSQGGFLTDIPSIYQPHDLQHIHIPRFFSRRTIAWRDVAFRAYSDQARFVVTMSHWGRKDLIDQLGLPPDKVKVVPPASPLMISGSDQRDPTTEHEADLPGDFFFYPAQTWPHKNHIAIVKAMRILHDRHRRNTHLVCTGALNEHYPELRAEIERHGLGEQVTFLGFVEASMIKALYRRCTALVFPSMFEGWGLPILEAFEEGTPVISSNASCLPEVTGGAALLFNPEDEEELAALMLRILDEESLRDELVSAGTRRAAEFTWERTARSFRALYRKALDQELSDEDLRIYHACSS